MDNPPTAVDAPEPVCTGDHSYTCLSRRYRQSYHSTHGALTQARHIYLEGAGVGTRLRLGLPTRVLEIGFGLGLNCLVTADAALTAGVRLEYTAAENDLVDPALLHSLGYARWLQAPALAGALTHALSAAVDPPLTTLAPGVTLQLALGDATASPWPADRFHAIYLDPFSEDVNPECWQPAFLARLRRALVDDGVLTSYSVRGSVRRNLRDAGFDVEKRPGPPGKRQMLRATPLTL